MIFRLYRLKKKFLILFITLSIFLSFILFLKSFFYKKTPSLPVVNSIDNSKFISEETLIKKIKNVNKLITLEIELSQVVTIDQSYGNLDILKKYKRLKFYSDCSYYVDLSEITKDDLFFDKELNILNLTLPKPKIYKININKEKLKEENSVNGFLRFGEIQLTTEEYKELELEVISSMEEKLNTEPIFSEAVSKTKISIETLIKDFIPEEVSLNITFK